ncbi:MAG TPA: hypothetical protein VN085_04735 [Vicinamibacterales bacterium]|nr:hypothetical protein [Vicinamibacterales bacterium]
MIGGREAIERAQACAEDGDFMAARFWLDMARELREEAFARLAWGPMMPAKAKQTDTQVLQRPDERPGDASQGDGERCENCGYFLRNTAVPGKPAFMVHTRTGLQVCPVGKPGPDDTLVHTFAAVRE